MPKNNSSLYFLRELEPKEKRPTDDFLDALLSVRSSTETKHVYGKWAQEYEKDILDMGYNGGPIAATSFLQLQLPTSAVILDIGAGTGIIGQLLRRHGYATIDALDGSEEMLAILKGKGCYRSVYHSLVGPDIQLPVKAKSYDVVLLAGVFCPGHMPIRSLEQMIPLVKAGGFICWSMGNHATYADRDPQYADGHFDKYIEQLAGEGKWTKVEGYPKVVDNYLHGTPGFFYAMKVL